MAFTRRLDKLPIVCRSAPGFVVNRVLMPYLHEAMQLAEEGVPLAAIDTAATDFGMPVGPIELADVVGLDVAKDVGEIIAARTGPTRADSSAARAAGCGAQARPQEWLGLLPLARRPSDQARGRQLRRHPMLPIG